MTKTGVTKTTSEHFGLGDITILPMSNEQVESWIETDLGELHFQEYYIKHRMQPEVFGINFRGIKEAQPCTGHGRSHYRF